MPEIKILTETDNYIVCIKPEGVTSEDCKQAGLPTLLQHDGIRPLVVHRLDREVSGLIVLAKTQAWAANISKQITHGTFKKEYLAVVTGDVDEHGILEDLLYHDRFKNKTYIVKSRRAGVKSARLEFWRLGIANTDCGVISLVRVKLYTGRTHQIRVQFASRRHPIVGDRKYGSKQNCSVALFSRLIGFIDDKNSEKIITETPQNVYPWCEFSENNFVIF